MKCSLKYYLMVGGYSLFLVKIFFLNVTWSAVKQKEQRGAISIPEGRELVNVNFPKPTNIRDIIEGVARWTGKNVIMGKEVRGQITIISPRKVTKEEAYQAFLSALSSLNLTAVETGKVIKIMRTINARKSNIRTVYGSNWAPLTDELVTQIIPLKYISAKATVSDLNRVIGIRTMVSHSPTNTVIISDTGYTVNRVLNILTLMDVRTNQPKVEIVPIKYADAKIIANKVSKIYKISSKGSISNISSRKIHTILVDERTNSVVIYGSLETIKDLKDLIKKFDVQLLDPSNQATVRIRHLDYANAKKLAATLSALTKSSSRSAIRRKLSLIAGKGAVDFGNNVKIIADDSANALIVTGSRSSYNAINTIIKKLDVRRSQVFVDMDILDIHMLDDLNLGTRIFASVPSGKKVNIPVAWRANAGLGALTTAAAGGTAKENMSKIAEGFMGNLTIGLISNQSISLPGGGKLSPGAMIQLLKKDENSELLASPHILTANNETGTLVVGESFFVTKENETNVGSVVRNTEEVQANLTIEIKPNISYSNYVTLDTKIEHNNITSLDPPQIIKRKTTQLITVKNQQAVVISGLIKHESRKTFEKVPLLGDIPILGWLFRYSSISRRKANLLIFMRPHIIHGPVDLANIYLQKSKELDEMLRTVNGDNYQDEELYRWLPSAKDGVYHPDRIDEIENQRIKTLRSEMYENISSNDPGFLELSESEGYNKSTKEEDKPDPIPPSKSVGEEKSKKKDDQNTEDEEEDDDDDSEDKDKENRKNSEKKSS